MAPIKFEEHVKEKLDEREIQPSEGSWDKLDSRLNNSKKSSGNRWWVSAAAAVVVLLIAGLIFVNQQKQSSVEIVDTPKYEQSETSSENMKYEEPVQVASEEPEDISESVKESSIKQEYKVPPRSEKMVSDKNPSESKESEQVAESVVENKNFFEPIFLDPPINSPENNYSNRIGELLAKVLEEENVNDDITESEVDALLAEAAREISSERNYYTEGSVNADDLLADVEFEVDQSFRKEVFDFLKEEFLKAKTAVATRND